MFFIDNYGNQLGENDYRLVDSRRLAVSQNDGGSLADGAEFSQLLNGRGANFSNTVSAAANDTANVNNRVAAEQYEHSSELAERRWEIEKANAEAQFGINKSKDAGELLRAVVRR